MELRLIEKEDLPQYKLDMQEAFQLGAAEGGFHSTEFFNARHPDPNCPEDACEDGYFEGMFHFQKATK